MSVKIINDNTDKLLAQVGKMAGVAMESIGQEMERYAKDDCPVDTSTLKTSISHTSSEKDAIVGTNVEYAIYVEFGTGIYATGEGGSKAKKIPWAYQDRKGEWHWTKGMKPHHMLKNAAGNHTDHYKAILEAALASLTL